MKEEIINASLQQFLEHGIQKVTMQKLAAVLGISAKTMFTYFENKEELLDECLKVYYREADKSVMRIIEGSPNAIVSICEVYSKAIDLEFGSDSLFLEDLNYYYPGLQDKAINKYGRGAVDILIGLIKQGISEGYFKSFLNPFAVFDSLSTVFKSVTRYEAYKEFDKKSALVKRTMGAYLRSICTDKGVLEMDKHDLLS